MLSLSATRNLSTSSAAPAQPEAEAVVNLSSSADLNLLNPSLLDNPVTHAPMFHHSLSEAFEAASSLAFAATNDHRTPIQFTEFLLDFTHLFTGLPWWATIVALTIGVRLALLPSAIFQAKHTARLQQMRPELEAFKEQMKLKQVDRSAPDYQAKVKELMAKYKTNPLYALSGPLFTFPVFVSLFFSIQAMHEIHPSFTAGGIGHVIDLSMADPYFILPVISSVTMLLPQEILGNTEMDPETFAKMKQVFRGFAVLMIPLAGQLPAGVFIYWITSNTWTFLQAVAFRLASVRARLGMPPLDKNGLAMPLDKVTQPVAPSITYATFDRNKSKQSKSDVGKSGQN